MSKNKELLFSVTAADCEWSYTKGTGAGGQKRNKTSSAVHCRHKPSGAYGYSESSRSQHENKIEAFRKMAESKEMKEWLHRRAMQVSGEMDVIEAEVERSLKDVIVEVKQDGRWVTTEDL